MQGKAQEVGAPAVPCLKKKQTDKEWKYRSLFAMYFFFYGRLLLSFSIHLILSFYIVMISNSLSVKRRLMKADKKFDENIWG